VFVNAHETTVVLLIIHEAASDTLRNRMKSLPFRGQRNRVGGKNALKYRRTIFLGTCRGKTYWDRRLPSGDLCPIAASRPWNIAAAAQFGERDVRDPKLAGKLDGRSAPDPSVELFARKRERGRKCDIHG